MPGVTSLSADTHKNGLAPKGSSVLITKNIESRNLAYYSIYSVPEWNGGVYNQKMLEVNLVFHLLPLFSASWNWKKWI